MALALLPDLLKVLELWLESRRGCKGLVRLLALLESWLESRRGCWCLGEIVSVVELHLLGWLALYVV